ncbi:MAG: ATP-binding protein [Deltaproteobacteria bacterium]|nr:ATP-binding protein [Deltaproteobacteria bacterium]
MVSKDSPSDDLACALQAIESTWFRGAPPPPELPGTRDQQARLARLLAEMRAAQDFALAVSKGDLSPALKARGLMAGALKSLQASLRHLTWQTQMIAQGDFNQRVDFMGEFSESFNSMVDKLAAARDQLLEANQDLEAFSYSVSHDLRAPLRAIEGFANILLEDHAQQLDAQGQRLLDVIIDRGRQMDRLINDILAFSRLGHGKVKKSEIDMTKLVKSAVSEIKAYAPTPNIQLTIKPLPPAQGDYNLIKQVWLNLLANAVKFTAPRETGHIELGGSLECGETIYFVKDNGIGFDPAHADKLFGAFQRLHGDSKFEGTGLGLAIVQRIIQRHGGRVWAEGKADQGATFFFSLPEPEK